MEQHLVKALLVDGPSIIVYFAFIQFDRLETDATEKRSISRHSATSATLSRVQLPPLLSKKVRIFKQKKHMYVRGWIFDNDPRHEENWKWSEEFRKRNRETEAWTITRRRGCLAQRHPR